MKLKAYELFGEWRGRRVIGENLGDALRRNGLRKPDEFGRVEKMYGNRIIAPVEKIKTGEWLPIKTVLAAEKESPGSKRGDHEYVTAIVEIEGGRIIEVDALPKGDIN